MPAVTAAILCDLDGVIWLAHQPIAGSVEAVARLRAAGHRVLFVTNNSSATKEQHLRALEKIGIRADGDLVTSAQACGSLIPAGTRVLVAGGPGLEQAVVDRGAVVLHPDEVDRDRRQVEVVVVGFHRHFDFEGLRRASQAVREGAALVASNDDATYPTPDGEIPGGGSILAAIETASGRRAVVAGKPYRPMAAAVIEALGGVAMEDVIMVGDRPSTDGRLAEVLGCRFALVRSGVTQPGWTRRTHPDFFADCPVHLDLANMSAVADAVIGASGRATPKFRGPGTIPGMANNPINRDALKKLLDTVTPMSPEAAERFVKELMRIGDERRKDAERLVGEVSAAGRRSAEHFASAVQQEVAKQLGRLVQRIDTLERQLEHVNRNLETTRTAVAAAASKAVSRALPTGAASTPKKKSNGKKSGAGKSGAGKSGSGKTAAKASASKKGGAGKSGSGKGGKKKSAAPSSSGTTSAATSPAG